MLTRGPANPALPRLEVQRRRTERQQCDPLSLDLGDIPQPLANEPTALEIMLLFEVIIKPADFILPDQPNRDVVQNLLFGRFVGQKHALSVPIGAKNVQSNLEEPALSPTSYYPDESAVCHHQPDRKSTRLNSSH